MEPQAAYMPPQHLAQGAQLAQDPDGPTPHALPKDLPSMHNKSVFFCGRVRHVNLSGPMPEARLEAPGGGEVNLILSMQGEVQAGDVIELQARVQGDQQLYQETPISRFHPETDLDLYKSIIDMKHNVPQLKENFGF
jgi:hypothetical protein